MREDTVFGDGSEGDRMALQAAGAWTFRDEVLSKLILIGFWVIAYLGYRSAHCLATMGPEAVVSGTIFGALDARMARR